MNGNFLYTIKDFKQRELILLSELVIKNEQIQKQFFEIRGKSSDFKLKAEKLKISFTKSIMIIYRIIERNQV